MPGDKRRPSVPAWRRPAAAKPQSRAGWKQRPARRPADNARRLKIAGAVAALVAVNLALFGAAYWLWPPKPACLVLIGAGYEENLTLPHNVYGWEGLTALAEFSQRRSTSLAKWDAAPLRLKDEPLRLTSDSDWGRLLDQFAEPTVVIYLALHGGADADGPYLLPHDASPGKGGRLRLRDLLARLEQLPPSKNKVLLLDATGPVADAEWGMLPNDFARSVVELHEQIEKVPNLVVLSAADAEQSAQAWEGGRRTAFAHFVLEGLRGHADVAPGGDADGRVNALELHRYVRRQVEEWAARRRAARQTPVLLGGEERARSIHVIAVKGQVVQVEDESAVSEAPHGFAESARVFARLRQHAAAEPYAPHIMAQYQAYAVRLEQLLRAGAVSGLDAVRKELDRLDGELARQPLLDLASHDNALPLPSVTGRSGAVSASQVDALARQLLDTPPAEMRSRWEAAARKAGSAAQQQQLRMQVGARTLELAAEQPMPHLARAALLVNALGFAGNERPAELHFLAMLHRDLPTPAPPAGLLAKALRVRRLGEQAAWAEPPDSASIPAASYCEQIAPWIRDNILLADEARRRGEDRLLTSDATAGSRADAFLDAAERHYAAATQTAAAVRHALTVRDHAFAALPVWTRWTLRRPQPVEADVGHLEDLWQQAHRLAESLENPAADLGPLTAKANELSEALAARAKSIEQHCRQLASQPARSLRQWQDLEAALLVPELDRDLRVRLLAQAHAILRADAEAPDPANAEPVAQEPAGDQAVALAQYAGRLALAQIGRRDFEALGRDRPRHFDQLCKQLKAAANKEGGGSELRGAGEGLSAYYRQLPEHLQRLYAEAGRASANESVGGLAEAERIARNVRGVNSRPAAEAVRRARWCDVLTGQAERVRLDHWAADSELGGAEPYYVAAALRYLRDARAVAQGSSSAAPRLQSRFDEVARLEVELRKPSRLSVQGGGDKDAVATTESHWPLAFQLHADASLPPGNPVVWLEAAGDLRVRQPGRRTVEVAKETRDVSVPFEIALNPGRATIDSPTIQSSAVTLRGLYRGQRLHHTAEVRVQKTPDTVVHIDPPARQARLAVRAAPEIFERYAPEKGAVAIVLDCSHSMLRSDVVEKRQAYRGKFFKNYDQLHDAYDAGVPCDYHEATDALGQMLATLPEGLNLSVFAFGQKLPGVQRARDAIRPYRPPGPWHKEELPSLMERLRALEPWNRSPTLRAMLTAKRQGFPPDFGGFKTLLVLTDDEDNEFQNDAELNPDGKATPDDFFRREFADQGVLVRFVGYKVKSGDEPRFRGQLERPYNQLPLGNGALAVDRPEELATRLQQALRRELRFQIVRADGAPVPGMPDGGWLVQGGNAPDTWAAVEPGTYQVRVQGDQLLNQSVALAAGDSLRLLIGADGASLKPMPVDGGAPVADRGGWRLSVLERGAGPASPCTLTLNERPPPAAQKVLQQRHPAMVWFESQAVDQTALPLRWRADYAIRVPAWSLQFGVKQDIRPRTLSAWWSSTSPTPQARLARSQGDDLSASLKGASALLGGDAAARVVVEDVAWEPGQSDGPSGTAQSEVCLVVRFRYPESSPVWVRLDGPDGLREEHRWYRAANKYIATFAGLTPEQGVQAVRGLAVFSLRAWKQDAATQHADLPLDKPESR